MNVRDSIREQAAPYLDNDETIDAVMTAAPTIWTAADRIVVATNMRIIVFSRSGQGE
jgi:hypothetical protein